MDTNEIMVNEEVMEATEEIATAGSGKGFKVAVGVGLAVLGGVIAYKYLIKPMVAQIKAKKNQQAAVNTCFDDQEDDDVEKSEETDE